MAQLLPRETKFVALLTKSDVYSYFNDAERIEMTSFEDDEDLMNEEISFDYGQSCIQGKKKHKKKIKFSFFFNFLKCLFCHINFQVKSMFSVTVIINEIGDLSSNPWWGCLCLIFALMFLGKVCIHLLSPWL